MKAVYTLSRPVLPAGTSSKVDLLVAFRADAAQGPARRGLNLSLVIDRSGSMAGAPLKHALQASRNLIGRMGPEDWISIVAYDDAPMTVVPPRQVDDRAAIEKMLTRVNAAGCTNLTGGWQQGVNHVKAQQSRERINRVLLLTDGQANVGITRPDDIVAKVKEAAGDGISTTALGFGSNFNEDLLIGMAGAGEGHFYFIQSPDDAEGVFGIEMEGLSSVAAQNLVVTIQPAPTVKVASVLNRYRFEARGQQVEVGLGDVYSTEDRQLAVELSVDAGAAGSAPLVTLAYKYQSVVDGVLKEFSGELPVMVTLGSEEEASALSADKNVLAQTNRLRIAQVKDRAIELADQGDLKGASQQLRNTISELSANIDKSSFELVEEVEQLEHYAKRLESKKYDSVIRKELRDQSYQASTRNRNDLALRGTAGGSADELEAVSSAEGGVVVKCEREGGKLRVRAVSEGYDASFNIQFPRSVREEGVTYLVEKLVPSADGTFYRAQGTIKRLVLPGQERAARAASGAGAPRKTGKASKVTGSAKDLPTTNSIGGGVLVQCVKEGSKLRARVVSDGFDPNLNMRFPRDIREEGILYVVDEVIEVSGGGSYIACGDIKRLVQ
jgi:Ca-activated chloride channel family protein